MVTWEVIESKKHIILVEKLIDALWKLLENFYENQWEQNKPFFNINIPSYVEIILVSEVYKYSKGFPEY